MASPRDGVLTSFKPIRPCFIYKSPLSAKQDQTLDTARKSTAGGAEHGSDMEEEEDLTALLSQPLRRLARSAGALRCNGVPSRAMFFTRWPPSGIVCVRTGMSDAAQVLWPARVISQSEYNTYYGASNIGRPLRKHVAVIVLSPKFSNKLFELITVESMETDVVAFPGLGELRRTLALVQNPAVRTKLRTAYHLADALHRFAWQGEVPPDTSVPPPAHPTAMNMAYQQVASLPQEVLGFGNWDATVETLESHYAEDHSDVLGPGEGRPEEHLDLYELVPALRDKFPIKRGRDCVPQGTAAWPAYLDFHQFSSASGFPCVQKTNGDDVSVELPQEGEPAVRERLHGLLEGHRKAWQAHKARVLSQHGVEAA
eukprot:CAMPEP_0118985184 /NCGR_PEP_ID=MMETSP1173-20130426/39396_1 /TAXON_ID=1034831 /ORGANISM="Rhizochromulina marina cf, Strain CCMP1243" /LENGTH=369 /DNA_ID=CAMNT_0006935889 /DNA_START=38 /DNA_END=1143 /DNA_ORIENTATION=-